MKIRETDNDEIDVGEIKSARATKPWMQAVIAALLAIATALGGISAYRVDQVVTDPEARADPFTGKDAARLEDRLQAEFTRRLREDLEANMRQWEAIAKHIEKQHSTMETLRETVTQMLSRCAEIQQRDNAMQAQIVDLRGLLYQHLGITGNGKSHRAETP